MRKNGVSSLVGKVVIVGVKAAKEIPRAALVWALTHVVQPGNCIKLLVVVPHVSSSNSLKPFFIFYFSFFVVVYFDVGIIE